MKLAKLVPLIGRLGLEALDVIDVLEMTPGDLARGSACSSTARTGTCEWCAHGVRAQRFGGGFALAAAALYGSRGQRQHAARHGGARSDWPAAFARAC